MHFVDHTMFPHQWKNLFACRQSKSLWKAKKTHPPSVDHDKVLALLKLPLLQPPPREMK